MTCPQIDGFSELICSNNKQKEKKISGVSLSLTDKHIKFYGLIVFKMLQKCQTTYLNGFAKSVVVVYVSAVIKCLLISK